MSLWDSFSLLTLYVFLILWEQANTFLLSSCFPQLEDEISTLRQVLAAKEKHLVEIKQKLGISLMNELKQNFSKSWHDMQTTSAWVLIFILTHMNIPCFSKTELIATVVERTTHLSSMLSAKLFAFFSSSFDNWIWHLRRRKSELLHNWAELGVDSKEGRVAVASSMKQQSHNTWTKRAEPVQWQQRGSGQEFRSPSASVLMSQVLG